MVAVAFPLRLAVSLLRLAVSLLRLAASVDFVNVLRDISSRTTVQQVTLISLVYNEGKLNS